MSKIHLHIEQLSLPGYTPAERRAFVAALERELITCLAPSDVPRELQSEQRRLLRVTSPDPRPQSVARSAVVGLALGTGKEITK
jgi:hypothetical protein